ncbi:williams-Beuren syndrome critical region protein 22 [Hysterangium stoloniferum]|nr:williams-Beuren syndrome critical region protein 22 [Hysterangium stoloniferum]
MSRPELQAPPEIYYNDTEAKKYTQNTRNQEIQASMTYRALELLALPEGKPSFVLDIGCGSGLSGEILEEEGHVWAGVDISPSMLEVALERDVEGDLFLQDIGQGFGFRPGSFDGAISISVLQWLFNAETSHPTSSPPHRLTRFFTTLHSALKNPSRAVFQFYPTSDSQITLCSTIARRAGFGGGIVVDYPNSKKARKVFLCLFVGSDVSVEEVPRGLDGEREMDVDEGAVQFERRREREHKRPDKKRKNVKTVDKDWILKKKELYRQRGKEDVPRDSKYTGRKRRVAF